jgi:hypothetical protein
MSNRGEEVTSQSDNETVSPMKVGLGAAMGQRPEGHLAVSVFDDSADGNLDALV